MIHLGKKKFLPPYFFFKEAPLSPTPQQKKGAQARCPGPSTGETIDQPQTSRPPWLLKVWVFAASKMS